jgi:hypothetical protein
MNVGLTYQMLRGRNQMRARNTNAPVNGVVPTPSLGIVTQIESTGRSSTDRLQAQFRFGIPQRRINFNVNYTYGFARSHLTGTALPSDSLNPDVDWGPSGQDIRHQIQGQAMMPLPYGMRFNAQLRAQSGPAYNWTTGLDDNRDGVVNDRPAGVTRNALRGDGYWTVGFLRVSKSFGFGGPRGGNGGGPLNAQQGGRGGGGGRGPGGGPGGFENSRYNVELFASAQNPLNRVVPQGYSGNELSPFFGRYTNVQPARRMDFGLAFRF